MNNEHLQRLRADLDELAEILEANPADDPLYGTGNLVEAIGSAADEAGVRRPVEVLPFDPVEGSPANAVAVIQYATPRGDGGGRFLIGARGQDSELRPALRQTVAAWLSWLDGQRATVDNGHDNGRPQRKKSAAQGEAETKLRSAMMIHHGYDEGSIGDLTPAKIPDLMALAKVAKGTVSGFIKRHFGGFMQYRARCRDSAALVDILRKMEGNTPNRFSGGGDALDHVADPNAVDHNAPED